jgi:hypothetical protein
MNFALGFITASYLILGLLYGMSQSSDGTYYSGKRAWLIAIIWPIHFAWRTLLEAP